MATTSRHDAWAAGESYDAYMGWWSRPIAARFLDWLGLPRGLDWLDIGCGTGAQTQAILARCAPASVLALDPSQGFLTRSREITGDPRAEFRLGSAADLAALPPTGRGASRDAAGASPGRHAGLLCLGLSRRRHRLHPDILDRGGGA